MDEIRRQLAELMDSVDSTSVSKKSFTDSNICKYYLTGLCPHELFQNTKQYLGECSNIHSDDLRDQYLEARKKATYGYEEMAMRCLKPHIEDCDRRIARQTSGGRCDTQDKASESIEASAKREVDALEIVIAQKMKEAEELGNSGDVGGSMKAMDEVNQLNMKKKQALEEKSCKVEEAKNMYFQKLRPCEACGALLSETSEMFIQMKDGENRLNEHFLGRIHLGFEAIRKHVKELDEYLSNVASKLPRDSAYNCRPSSSVAPIRSDSVEDSGSNRRRSIDDYHRPSVNHLQAPHERGGNFSHHHRNYENGSGKRWGSRYGGRDDRRESPSRRHHYRDEFQNRREIRNDDRYKHSSRYGRDRDDLDGGRGHDNTKRDRYQLGHRRGKDGHARDGHATDSWREESGHDKDEPSDLSNVDSKHLLKENNRHSLSRKSDRIRSDHRSRSSDPREQRRRDLDRSRSTSRRRPPTRREEKRTNSMRIESDEEEGQIDHK